MLPPSISFSPPPPTPPPPPLATTPQPQHLSPTILIITGLIALVFITSASIHFLLRFFSRRNHHHNHDSYPSLPSSFRSAALPALLQPHPNENQKAFIDSLPLFTLSSSLSSLPKSTPDCAVCLSKFHPHDQLRLLPACSHAFHSSCVDTWLRSTPSCPLCRSSIVNVDANANTKARLDGSGSFRVEIGSVSRRREISGLDHGRSYSLGSAYEYMVEEEIEAVVAEVAAHVRGIEKEEEETATTAGEVRAPGVEVAEGVGGSGRWWLKEYVDRLATSASSSFSSLRFSGRWSRRSDTAAANGGTASWDLEENNTREITAFYRWLTGV